MKTRLLPIAALWLFFTHCAMVQAAAVRIRWSNCSDTEVTA